MVVVSGVRDGKRDESSNEEGARMSRTLKLSKKLI